MVTSADSWRLEAGLSCRLSREPRTATAPTRRRSRARQADPRGPSSDLRPSRKISGVETVAHDLDSWQAGKADDAHRLARVEQGPGAGRPSCYDVPTLDAMRPPHDRAGKPGSGCESVRGVADSETMVGSAGGLDGGEGSLWSTPCDAHRIGNALQVSRPDLHDEAIDHEHARDHHEQDHQANHESHGPDTTRCVENHRVDGDRLDAFIPACIVHPGGTVQRTTRSDPLAPG